jgi:hypothetical protein
MKTPEKASDLDELYYQTNFEPPEQKGDHSVGGGAFDQFYLKKGRMGIGRFQPNPAIKEVVQRRAHYIQAVGYSRPCRECSTINIWGDACEFFKAQYDRTFARLVAEHEKHGPVQPGSSAYAEIDRRAKRESRASTQFLYNWVGGVFGEANEILYQRAYYLQVSYNDAEERLASKRKAAEAKCQCNQAGAMVHHIRWECRECGAKILWADADRQARRAPGPCRECGVSRIPKEVVRCDRACAKPTRGNIYSCDFIIQKQGDGRLDFDPQPFGPMRDEWQRHEPLDLYAILEREWVPQAELLACAGLSKGGKGPARSIPSVHREAYTSDASDDVPF